MAVRNLSLPTRLILTAWLLTTGLAANPYPSYPSPDRAPRRLSSQSYLFGVVSDEGQYYDELWNRGVRATTFELQWKRYEPQEGIYDLSYISHMKQIVAQLNRQGWVVQMIPGFHYAPDWVFTHYPDVYYVNQYGERYNPNPVTEGDHRAVNGIFSPKARTLIAGYLNRIFLDFNQNVPDYKFDSIRIGGGVQGELRYPPPVWNNHPNSYWAFDPGAQNPAISAIPANAIGWRPGIDPNPGTVGRGQLVVNPGFEKQEVIDPYHAWSPDEEVFVEFTSQNLHSGSRALRITLSTANRIHQYVKVTPNTIYNYGAWLKSSTNGARARFFITQYSAAWQPVPGITPIKLETLASSWTQLSSSIQTEPTTVFLKIELDGDRPGTFYFDDLWLIKSGDASRLDRTIDTPTAFYNWYVQRLTDYQNWQITEIRKYFPGQLDIVYAGKGVRPVQITDALTNDLTGDGWSESSSAIYSGADYSRHIAGLSTALNITIYTTGIENPAAGEVNDQSPFAGDWSGAHWLAYLARSRNLPIWGENTGANDRTQMALSYQRMRTFGYYGLMWAFESQLFTASTSNAYANINDLAFNIQYFSLVRSSFLPLTSSGR